jgi:mRNA-degrading endonuclease toxin of MazEF toxin-antitoxin module
VALVFQLRAIDRRRVQEQIGRAGTAVLQEMLAELDKLTGRVE